MKLRPWHVLLFILTVTDAYLISHPNLLGRFGIWFYRYSYFKNFPNALITVGLTVGIAFGLTELTKRNLPARSATLLLALLLVAAVATFVGVFVKFSSGTYRFTGKAFIYGMHLLPGMLVVIFAQGLYEVFRTGKLNEPPNQRTSR
jgi:ABC-type spermidine/putrescine transport system permease subunit II